MRLFGTPDIDREELKEYLNERYGELDDMIGEADAGEFEDQIRIVEWKGRQEEIHLMYERFGFLED